MARRRRGMLPRKAAGTGAGAGADKGAYEDQYEDAGLDGRAWTSALSTGEFAAIGSVGFEPVGQVMGSVVLHIGRSGRRWGYHDCEFPYGPDSKARYGLARTPSNPRSSRDPRYVPPGLKAPIALSGNGALSGTVVEVYDRARHIVLDRMSAECRALGGDGVVAASLTMAPLEVQPNCTEFRVIGTAVRAVGGSRHLKRAFTSHLDGHGFTKLVAAGWMPVELLVGMSIGVRHDDFGVRVPKFSRRNVEMTGWSELVQAVRSDARRQLRLHAARRGGNGLILADSTLRVWEERCLRSVGTDADGELHDHLAESTMVGSSIVQFSTRRDQRRTLTVLPLGDRGEVLRARLAAAAASAAEQGPGAQPSLTMGELPD